MILRGLLTDTDISTALVDNARSSGTGQGGLVLADTGEVGDIAAGAGGDGIRDAGQSTGWDVGERLSSGEGNDGQTSESVLHFCGFGGG